MDNSNIRLFLAVTTMGWTPPAGEAEKVVIRWLLTIVGVIAVIWISISAWRTLHNCQQQCINRGFERSHLKFQSFARGVVSSCVCK